MKEDPDERALLERVRGDDGSAEDLLLRRYERRVRFMVQHRIGNVEIARELTQDVLMNALQALRAGKLRDADRLPAFIHGIARNIVNGYLRSRGQQTEVALDPEMGIAAPNDDAESAARNAAVRKGLASLAPDDRKILLMTLVEGLKPGVIATRLGLGSEVVRQRKSRAIKRIRDILEKEGVLRS